MKLQRTTLILLASAVLLGGFVYFYEVQGAPKREAVKTIKQPIFSFKEDQIQSLTIYINEETLEFERISEQQPAWRMKKPQDVPASDPAVSFLLNLLVEGKRERTFTVPADQRQEYGLNNPQATVEIKLKDQKTHRIILGKPDFNSSFLYAQVDPPSQASQQLEVLLVPVEFQYAVNRPMSEWQSKPETSESPTPSPTAKEGTPGGATPSPAAKEGTPGSATPSPAAKEGTPDSPKPSPTASPGASSSPTPSPAASPKTSKTATPSPTASPRASSSPTPSPTASPGASSSPTPSPAARQGASNTASPSPAARQGASNTATPSPTANQGASSRPTPSPAARQGASNTASPSPTASPGASSRPTPSPAAREE
jgi:hypothetical protein